MHTAMKSSSCPLSHRWRVLSAWLTAAIGASVRQRGHTEALGSIVSRQARHGRPAGEIPSEAASVTGPNRMPNANHPSALRLFVCATQQTSCTRRATRSPRTTTPTPSLASLRTDL